MLTGLDVEVQAAVDDILNGQARHSHTEEPPNPKLRGTTHLAERVCEFY